MRTVVLLAAFNGSGYLPELLDSLLSQTDPDFTVIMQDDGSADRTPDILRETAHCDERFVFGEEQGKHLGAAGNFLSMLRQTEADRYLLCDQDDIWEPDKISVLKKSMEKQESLHGADTPLLVHSDCALVSNTGSLTSGSFFRYQGWDPAAVSLPRLLVQNNVTGCTLIMNRPLRDLVSEHAKAEELFMHDWFIALTAASFGRIAFIDRPLTRYRQHSGNAVGASGKKLPARAVEALRNRDAAKQRILLTYTQAKVFRNLYGSRLPAQAQTVVDAYLSTQRLPKIRRVFSVLRMGCVMQSPVTRIGQILFG